MSGLPAPPALPLPLLPQGILRTLAGIVLALFVLWLWRRWRRRRPLTESPPPPPRPAPLGGLEAALATLLAETLAGGRFREGCHRLAAAVRGHLERVAGIEAEEMTTAEIEKAVAEPRIGELMRRLRGHQFGRREPERRDFENVYEKARRVFVETPPARWRS